MSVATTGNEMFVISLDITRWEGDRTDSRSGSRSAQHTAAGSLPEFAARLHVPAGVLRVPGGACEKTMKGSISTALSSV
jgi:hypothetical protein